MLRKPVKKHHYNLQSDIYNIYTKLYMYIYIYIYIYAQHIKHDIYNMYSIYCVDLHKRMIKWD